MDHESWAAVKAGSVAGLVAAIISLSYIGQAFWPIFQPIPNQPVVFYSGLAVGGITVIAAGALLGLVYSRIKGRLPGRSTLVKAAVFQFALWLAWLLLVSVPLSTLGGNFLESTLDIYGFLSGLVTQLLWAISFAYLFDRWH